MYKLGVLGLGNRSTLYYIDQLNKMLSLNLNSYSTFPFILLNTNFETINKHLPDQFSALEKPVKTVIDKLLELEVNTILIPNITLHEAIDRFYETIDLHHPLHLAVKALTINTVSEVYVFGSNYTMTSEYIRNYFNTHKIKAIPPLEDDRKQIDSLRKKLYSNSETKNDIENYLTMLSKYSRRSPVILACTELSLVTPKENLPIYDMVQLQIEDCVTHFMSSKK